MNAIAAAKLAECMGLSELRAGCHILRDARRWREGEIFVTDLWYAAIHPSFHDDAILCYAATEETEFRGKRFEAWRRAGLLLNHQDRQPTIAWVPVEDDLLRPVVANLDLMARTGSGSLDGIGYEVCFPSGDLDACITFGNPVLPELCEIEAALYETGRRVADATKEAEIVAYTQVWRKFLSRK